MQLGDNADESNKVTVGKLPCDFHVEGFACEYAKYLELCNYTPDSTGAIICSALLFVCSLILVVVGTLTSLFGPETITYSRSEGPGLLQFIQLYPGHISIFGALLAVFGRFLINANGLPPFTPESYLLRHYELQFAEVSDDLSQVSISYVDGEMFHISRHCV